MHGRLLVVLIVLAGAAQALPTTGEHHVGVARQGSLDVWASPTSGPCVPSVQRFTFTLTLLSGVETDKITLLWNRPGQDPGNATATPLVTRKVHVDFASPCDVGFSVLGTNVTAAAPYDLEVARRTS